MQQAQMDEVEGDGGKSEMTDAGLTALKDEVTAIVDEGRRGLWAAQIDSEDTRYCRWDGQSTDGRKHQGTDTTTAVMPFEGACDTRVRLSDMLVNEDVMLVVLATIRAMVRVITGVESTDSERAGRMELVLRWMIRNQVGVKFLRELIKLANYVMGDSPAVGFMSVVWRKEMALKMEKLTMDDLITRYVSAAIPDGSDPAQMQPQINQIAQEFQALMSDPLAGEDTLMAILMQMFPHLKSARARKAIKDLQAIGEAEFPMPYVRFNGLDMNAKRLYEDFFLPINTTDFQRARCYFEPEWMSKTEIMERITSEGWDEAFVDDVLKYEAEAAFPEFIRQDQSGNIVERGPDAYRGLYQVVTAYYQAINDDGIPGRYYTVIHMNSNKTAFGRRLLDYQHGKYCGHVFTREVLTSRLLDSRGIPEIEGPNQSMIKLHVDGFGDNAQLNAVPPIVTRNRKGAGDLYIAPLVELQAKRDGDYKFLQPPAYPTAIVNMLDELRLQVNEYHGRRDDKVPDDLVAMHREYKTTWWLWNMREVWTQALQLIQQYVPEETLRRVSNSRGSLKIAGRDEIQGQFDLQVIFDPRDMDPEYLERVGRIIKDLLLAVDRDKTINTSAVVSSIFWRLSPDIADLSLRGVDEANQDEINDEIKQYQSIRSGLEPELPDDGSINYPLRLQFYQNVEAMNPAAYSDMAEDKVKILQSRIQRMSVLAQQYGENVQIGREGGRRALGAGAEGAQQ